MIKKLLLKVKKYSPWILAVILFISLAADLFYKQRLAKAEITQAVLIEKARLLEADRQAIREKFNLLGQASTIKIESLTKQIIEKDRASQSILVKTAKQIRDLRLITGTWESKYGILEGEALQLTAKVKAQDETIGLLHLAMAELNDRDKFRAEHIEALEGKLGECQRLLDISIANTNSILKKGWFWKLFGNIKIGPGGGFSISGHGDIGIYAIWAIN